LLAKVPAGRVGRLDEIATVVEFLLSPAAPWKAGPVSG
jgi:NAD(P)-dependent dehydrogenase (short-subunit alcohol dehydrogenase family)